MLKQAGQRGNEQLNAIEGELSITFVQFVDALGGQNDPTCGMTEEVGHFTAVTADAASGSCTAVNDAPVDIAKVGRERDYVN